MLMLNLTIDRSTRGRHHNLAARNSITATVRSMVESVVPQSIDPSLDALCSYPFCDPGAACKSIMTFRLYLLLHPSKDC